MYALIISTHSLHGIALGLVQVCAVQEGAGQDQRECVICVMRGKKVSLSDDKICTSAHDTEGLA